MILIPKYRNPLACNVNAPLQFGGMFKFVAVNKGDGRRRVLADWFNNLITNNGLNELTATYKMGDACHVGTGSTPPQETDSGLDVFLAESDSYDNILTGTSNSLTPPYYGYQTRTYTFDIGNAEGNLTEVGVGSELIEGRGLMSRALILDGNSNPTTLTVLANEILEVTYKVRVYGPTDDVASTTIIDGETYNTLQRIANLATGNSFTDHWRGMGFGQIYPPQANDSGTNPRAYGEGDLGSVLEGPTGSNGIYSASRSTISVGSYSNNTFQRSFTHHIHPDDWNLSGGIRTITITPSQGGSFQIRFKADGNGALPLDSMIPKDQNKSMDLTFTHSWGRYVAP